MSDRSTLENAQNVEELLDAFEDDLHPAWTGEERVRGLVWHVLRKKLLVVLEEIERLKVHHGKALALHQKVDAGMAAELWECSVCIEDWPCPTLKALKGGEMTPRETLERIEARYGRFEERVARDVVKLAQALAQFVRAKKYTSGVSMEFATEDAERVLREVAGGKP